MRVLILGATGLVGSSALEHALAQPYISTVIAPTRRPLPPHTKLLNPVADDLLTLLPQVASWKPDAAIYAIGTTMRKAGSKALFHQVDHDLPLAFANVAYRSGAETFALVSAMGSSVDSLFFYSRTKGETERDIQQIGFRSVTIGRPGIIGGRRTEARFAESLWVAVARLLAPILPKSLRVNPATAIAAALISALLSTQPGRHLLSSSSLVKGSEHLPYFL